MVEKLEKWQNLGADVEAIAKALVEASEGKVTRLRYRWNDPRSVWEDACRRLFPNTAITERDKFFLWSVWVQERKGIPVRILKILTTMTPCNALDHIFVTRRINDILNYHFYSVQT